MTKPTIICPYIFPEELSKSQTPFWELDITYERDINFIGSDLMFQKLWNQCDTDIIILHADMFPFPDYGAVKWYTELLSYVEKYPEAGIIGSKLLYPLKNTKSQFFIQFAGGVFDENRTPKHIGSGFHNQHYPGAAPLVADEGQYDAVRETNWSTFGGCYIRREVIKQVGDFDPIYEWTYNRDVDYCLEARKLGWKIYQTPAKLIHQESRDNILLRQNNRGLNIKEFNNLQKLQNKWRDNPELFAYLNRNVDG